MLRLSNTALFTSVACAFGLLTAGAPALAQNAQDDSTVVVWGANSHPDTVSTRVGYSDLDLTTGSGQKALHQRVRAAAHKVCRQLGEDPGPVGFASGCEDQAIHDAAMAERSVISKAKTQSYATMASLSQ